MRIAASSGIAALIICGIAAAAAAPDEVTSPPGLTDEPRLRLAQAANTDAVQTARPAIRDVTAPGMTPGPEVDGPLRRIAVPEPPPLPPRWRRSYGAVAVDAGTLDIGPRHARLAGIVAPGADQVCSPDGGPSWPCGRAALTALRLLLRGRAVECYLAPDTLDDPVEAPCRVGTTELAAWLVAQGWAEPADAADADLGEAARAAKCAGRGMWRDRVPPPDCP